MFNLNALRKKEPKRRSNSLAEAQLVGQVQKVLANADQKLIVMVRG